MDSERDELRPDGHLRNLSWQAGNVHEMRRKNKQDEEEEAAAECWIADDLFFSISPKHNRVAFSVLQFKYAI